MSTEKLINSYIDGELTREEDKRLRDLLKEDAEARDDFNTNVELHLGIKEDADSIEPPEELLRNTEDKVLMKILGANKELSPQKKKQPVLSYMTAAVILLMFGFVYQIYEPQDSLRHYRNDNNAAQPVKSESAGSKQKDSNPNIGADNTGIPGKADANNIRNDIYASEMSGSETQIELDEIHERTVHSPEDFVFDALNSENINGNINEPSQEDNVLSAYNEFPVKPALQMNNINSGTNNMILLANGINNKKILLTSFVSNGLNSSGITLESGSSVTNYSQSIAYASSEKSNVGLEVGYMEFTATNNIPTRNNAGTFKTESMVEGFDGNLPNDDFVPPSLPVNVRKKFFWGSVFYERNIFNHNDVIFVDGRVGFGATSSGPLAYTRLFGKVRLIEGIYLNVGSEYRGFMLENNLNSEKYWGSTLSWIYGIQFSF